MAWLRLLFSYSTGRRDTYTELRREYTERHRAISSLEADACIRENLRDDKFMMKRRVFLQYLRAFSLFLLGVSLCLLCVTCIFRVAP